MSEVKDRGLDNPAREENLWGFGDEPSQEAQSQSQPQPDVDRSEQGFERKARDPVQIRNVAPAAVAPARLPKNEFEDMFESFMVNLVGKRGENDTLHWVSARAAGNEINFVDDKKFLATWESGVAPTYRSSINEAMDYANAFVGPWRKINLVEQIRKHRPYFQVLVHTKWVQAQRTAKGGNWPHRNVLLQESKNLKAIDKYYCAQAKL